MKVMPSAGTVTSPVAVACASAADLGPIGERDVMGDDPPSFTKVTV